jgi:hypothetical protein
VQDRSFGSYKAWPCNFHGTASHLFRVLCITSSFIVFAMKSTTTIGAAAALLAGTVSAQSFRRLGACPTLGTTTAPRTLI